MKRGVRTLLGIGMWLAIYLLAVYVIPAVSFINGLVEDVIWLSNGEISQVSLLILSMIFIFVLPGDGRKTYGFRGVGVGQLVKPVALAVLVSVLFFILNFFVILIVGMPSAEGSSPIAGKSLLNFFLTVVILASICEEIFNRGLVQGFLSPLREHGFKLFRQHISLPVSISGLLFGLGHLCLLTSMELRMVILIVISATFLGLVAGYYREKTGSLLPAVAVHMTFNIVSGIIPRLLMLVMMGGGPPSG
jgi:membrane protease YdiL (CAAX protease family)